MSTSLVDLSIAYRDFIETIDELVANGEMTEEEIASALQDLDGEIMEKITNMDYVIQKYKNDVKVQAEEIKRLQTRKKTTENIIKRLEEFIITSMRILGQEKIKTPLRTFTIRKSRRVEITNEGIINEHFKRAKTVVEIDKQLIKETIEQGEYVSGAVIKEYDNYNSK